MILKPNLINLKKAFFVCIVVIMSSCATRKQMVYFQDEPLTDTEVQSMSSEIVYTPNDLLTIVVSSLDPEASMPFNLSAVSFSESVISAQGILKMQTYLINEKGEIEFPVLGTLVLGGLSRSQATEFLKSKLTEYIKDPIVNVRLANFTITVIGEVNNPGTFTVENERVSVPQALGLAGDLTMYGKRDNIFLIREIDGKKRFAKLDLTSINIVNSPLYYLSQNDVLYIEPNNAKIKSSTFNPNTAVLISAISTLATITAILIR